MDAMLRGLGEAGFSPGLLDVAFHTLQNHIVGHALQYVAFPFEDDDLPAMSARYLEDFPSQDYPDLTAHIEHHMRGSEGEVSSFEFSLDAILDALERSEPGQGLHLGTRRRGGRRGPQHPGARPTVLAVRP